MKTYQVDYAKPGSGLNNYSQMKIEATSPGDAIFKAQSFLNKKYGRHMNIYGIPFLIEK
jgi:hypothetical protein